MKINDQIYYWSHMLDESFGRMLVEDVEGKNINKAEAWLRKNKNAQQMIGKVFNDRTIENVRDIISVIRHFIPASRLPLFRDENGNTRWITLANGDRVEKGTCKFMLGICRIYFTEIYDDEWSRTDAMNDLNTIVQYISDTRADAFDRDLNGATLEQLRTEFKPAIDEIKRQRRINVQKKAKGLTKNPDYRIVMIESFDDAEEYGDYVSWCVASNGSSYNDYTVWNKKRFYFVLKNGFEDLESPPYSDNEKINPLDEYGSSMLAVLIDADGSLDASNGCTCRYNNNGHVMDEEQIQNLLGVDFYATFKPRTREERISKFIEDSKNIGNTDELTIAMGLPATIDWDVTNDAEVGDRQVYHFLKGENIITYFSPCKGCLMNEDSILHIENGRMAPGWPHGIENSSGLVLKNIPYIKDFSQLPRRVKNFILDGCDNIKSLVGMPQVANKLYLSYLRIESLKGAPSGCNIMINGCDKLTSLEGCPQPGPNNNIEVEYCHNITSLAGCPNKFKNLKITLNNIKDMSGMPEDITGNIDLYYYYMENIQSLAGMPKRLNGDFICRGTEQIYRWSTGKRIESLVGSPEIITGNFDCTDGNLSSLEGGPVYVGGDYMIKNAANAENKLTSLKGAPGYIGGKSDYREAVTGPNAQAEIAAYEEFLKHSDGTKRFGE